MNPREWANNNPGITFAVAAVVLVAILMVLIMQFRGPGVPRGAENPAYFWDLETGEVFTAGANDSPPIAAPSGGEGVKAHLFACGECSPEQWFGYLETYGDEARAAVEELSALGEPAGPEVRRLEALIRDNHLIRPLDADDWVPASSPQGQRIQSEVRARCDGPPTRCRP